MLPRQEPIRTIVLDNDKDNNDDAHIHVVTSLAVDDDHIVVGMTNGNIYLFNTHDVTPAGVLDAHHGGVWCLALGSALTSGKGQNSGQEIHRDTEGPPGEVHLRQDMIQTGAQIRDQKVTMAVSGGADNDVKVWNVTNGECLHTLRGHTSTVKCVKMIDHRCTAVSGSRDSTLKIWDIEEGVLLRTLVGHDSPVRCIAAVGNLVASGSNDCRTWDSNTGECLQVLKGHEFPICAIAFDGKRVVTGSLDATVRVWSAASGDCLAVFREHTSLVNQLQLIEDTLISGGVDGYIGVFDLEDYTCARRINAHPGHAVTCLQFDGRGIVSGGTDGCVKIWDMDTATLVRQLDEGCEAVWKVALKTDGRVIVLRKRQGKAVLDLFTILFSKV